MHVRLSQTAENDLDQIHDYIAQDDPSAALLVVDRLLTTTAQLGNFPFLGRPGRVEDTRELLVPRTPYMIVYTIADEYHIDIETYVHTSRNWPSLE